MTTLSITQFDIKDGRKGSAADGAMSIAMNRLLKPEYRFIAFIWSGEVRANGKTVHEIEFPAEVSEWLWAYDRSGKADPINVELEIPAKYLRAA